MMVDLPAPVAPLSHKKLCFLMRRVATTGPFFFACGLKVDQLIPTESGVGKTGEFVQLLLQQALIA